MLSAADALRLEDIALQAHADGICDSNLQAWTAPHAIVDVRQSVGWQAISVQTMPTLCRRTVLWDLVADRQVPIGVLWMLQGCPFPFGNRLPSELIMQFPFPELVRPGAACCLTHQEQTRLAGNAMHWSQVGTVFLYLMACSAKKWGASLGSD